MSLTKPVIQDERSLPTIQFGLLTICAQLKNPGRKARSLSTFKLNVQSPSTYKLNVQSLITYKLNVQDPTDPHYCSAQELYHILQETVCPGDVVMEDRTRLTLGFRIRSLQATGYPVTIITGEKVLTETDVLTFIISSQSKTVHFMKQYVHHWSPQPCPQAPPKFCLAAVEKSWEKAWNQNYVTNRKWWTQLVRNVDWKWWTRLVRNVKWTWFVLTESTISGP